MSRTLSHPRKNSTSDKAGSSPSGEASSPFNGLEQPSLDRSLQSTESYRIKKFGLYRYQLCRYDAKTQKEVNIQAENDFGIVASNLIDLFWKELCRGKGEKSE
jgi:hypothetical protein